MSAHICRCPTKPNIFQAHHALDFHFGRIHETIIKCKENDRNELLFCFVLLLFKAWQKSERSEINKKKYFSLKVSVKSNFNGQEIKEVESKIYITNKQFIILIMRNVFFNYIDLKMSSHSVQFFWLQICPRYLYNLIQLPILHFLTCQRACNLFRKILSSDTVQKKYKASANNNSNGVN